MLDTQTVILYYRDMREITLNININCGGKNTVTRYSPTKA